ncbi:hypothetical protein A3770_07p47050 [Chloropicon primus]|uniref:RNA-editing substrate-binding complex 6 protein domain-containing protein n=1 Tax=Chloropicon primus TaxID=1764295 RepID=A0A5B8MP50_9CHLO|nr:hypothetical protein A3770_07p47050 [Chloropicon primus]|mmetsp:Transcript_22866/g.48328  ORF Transcript_22866/g.48328 Transcript_22866/m.48328 type:complete len:627 (+) Transcript_22866:279-2159(+)|eukprot:QDZ22187.1 hypothetical protein A3770_07p47050 [Chloropicon primus]
MDHAQKQQQRQPQPLEPSRNGAGGHHYPNDGGGGGKRHSLQHQRISSHGQWSGHQNGGGTLHYSQRNPIRLTYAGGKKDHHAIEKAKRLNYKLKEARDWKGILRQVELNLDIFNEVNIATALHRLAKIARDSNEKSKILRDPRLASLESKAQENMKLFTPQQLSNSAWACATLSYNSMPLLRGIEAQALVKLEKFNSQDLTNTIWAYAKLGYKPKQLMSGIAEEALHKLYDFNPQGLANTLWAFATLNHYGTQYSELLTGIASEAMKKIHNFNPQNLANSCWAYARLSYHPGDLLLEKIASAVVAKVDLFKPQELANLIWAMAKLNYRCEDLLYSVSLAAERRLHQYNPQNLANTCWAYAILDYHPGPLMAKIIYQAGRCITDFSQQGLSNTVWALAKLQHNPGDPFLMKVGSEAIKKMGMFSAQGMVNLSLAFACFEKHNKDLMDVISREVDAKTNTFNAQDLESLTWSFTRLGHPLPKALQARACCPDNGAEESPYCGAGGGISNDGASSQGYPVQPPGPQFSITANPTRQMALQARMRPKLGGLRPFGSVAIDGLLDAKQDPKQDAFLQTESFKIRGESLISGLFDSQDGSQDAKQEKQEAAQAQDQGWSMWQTKELCNLTLN